MPAAAIPAIPAIATGVAGATPADVPADAVAMETVGLAGVASAAIAMTAAHPAARPAAQPEPPIAPGGGDATAREGTYAPGRARRPLLGNAMAGGGGAVMVTAGGTPSMLCTAEEAPGVWWPLVGGVVAVATVGAGAAVGLATMGAPATPVCVVPTGAAAGGPELHIGGTTPMHRPAPRADGVAVVTLEPSPSLITPAEEEWPASCCCCCGKRAEGAPGEVVPP